MRTITLTSGDVLSGFIHPGPAVVVDKEPNENAVVLLKNGEIKMFTGPRIAVPIWDALEGPFGNIADPFEAGESFCTIEIRDGKFKNYVGFYWEKLS